MISKHSQNESSKEKMHSERKTRAWVGGYADECVLFAESGGASCFLVAQMAKNLPAKQETQVQSLGLEDPLEKVLATQSSILVWRIPWTEEPGRLQSMRSQRIGHDWVTNIHLYFRDVSCELLPEQWCYLYRWTGLKQHSEALLDFSVNS